MNSNRQGASRGGGRVSRRLGAQDPRNVRNPQRAGDVRTNFGPEFELDKRQRVTLSLGDGLARDDSGTISVDVEYLRTALGL